MGEHKRQPKSGATQAKKPASVQKPKTIDKSKKKESKTIADKLPLKKWWFWVIVIILLSMLGSTIANIGKKSKEVAQEYTALKEVDINGMTIAEACAAVREAGWTVREISNTNNYSEKSDCSDSAHKVSSSYYHKEKYYTYNGTTRDDYETVSFSFIGDKKQEEKQELVKTDSSSSETGASTSNTNSDFRKTLESYESFMSSYVDFMKKYKNASSTEALSMMSDYADMVSKYSEWASKIDDYNSDNLTADDWAYYLEVTARVLKKLSEIQ